MLTTGELPTVNGERAAPKRGSLYRSWRIRILRTAFAAAAVPICLGGCASIVEGTSQQLVINTNPAGADCRLMRDGQVVARVNPTPGGVLVGKTKSDITIVCDREGFTEATYLNHSGVAGATLGNIILGGGIGWAINSASGADNKYDSPVNLTLVPKLAADVRESGPVSRGAALSPPPPVTAPPTPLLPAVAPPPAPSPVPPPVLTPVRMSAPAGCLPGSHPRWSGADTAGNHVLICNPYFPPPIMVSVY